MTKNTPDLDAVEAFYPIRLEYTLQFGCRKHKDNLSIFYPSLPKQTVPLM